MAAPVQKETGRIRTPLLTPLRPEESRFRWYIFLAAFLVLPSLPLLLAARPISLLARGYVDLDYLLIGLLSLFVPRIVTFILLVAAVALDFIHAACITYFFAPAEFLHVLRYGGFLSTTRISLIIAAFIGTVLVCLAATAWTSPRAPARQRRIAFVTALITLIARTVRPSPHLPRAVPHRPGSRFWPHHAHPNARTALRPIHL
jgi:hypothetical protein